QIIDPVIWEFSQSTISDSEVELQFKASIEKHWHLYSQFTGQYYNDEGPIPTSFVFKESDFFIKKDSVIEEPPIEDYDPIWEETLKYYEVQVTFRQRIKLLTKDPFNITGEINFMLCDEAQCVFPMPVPFSFNINSNGSIQEAEEQEIVTNQDIENTEKYNDKLVDLDNPSTDCGEKKSEENSLWAIFLLGLLGGLIALITPCVFPMIPLTVSFFTKGEKGKGMFNAIMYGFFIMLIYFLLSIPFHIMPNIDPEILNQISTNSWLNLFFFAIFIAFALSFFGYFELALPSKWGNKADSGSNIGGLIGIFFMALTLAIVSFSCTGPILGSLLAGTLGGDVSTVVILGMEFKMVATKLTAGMT
ncbi:MAG: cytochrome c biogenesis protein CcdA, partial [Bacteroidota bacterium]|nr:cytochrome c biogenesis protein CcdA [Bacteroidota bacterium]